MIEETIPARQMGKFGIITNSVICFGVFICYLVGSGLNNDYLSDSWFYWRIVFGFPIIISIISLVFLKWAY